MLRDETNPGSSVYFNRPTKARKALIAPDALDITTLAPPSLCPLLVVLSTMKHTRNSSQATVRPCLTEPAGDRERRLYTRKTLAGGR